MVFLLSAILGLPKWLFIVLAAPTCLWLAAYVLPLLYIRLRGTQDLKKKYNAEWALVTGGAQGLGAARDLWGCRSSTRVEATASRSTRVDTRY